MNCTYCGNSIHGQYMLDMYGNPAHVEHAKMCFSCNRFVTATDVQLPDGRWQCADCRQKEVRMAQHIHWVYARVRKMLEVHGITEWPSGKNLTIELVQPKFFPGRPPTKSHQFGLTITRSSLVRKTHRVQVLNHLHRIVFAGVLGHELLHVWQHELGIKLRSELSEGFCNLGSWVVYQKMQTPISDAMMRHLENDPTPVYGTGFKIAKSVYDQLGNGSLPDTMTELRKME